MAKGTVTVRVIGDAKDLTKTLGDVDNRLRDFERSMGKVGRNLSVTVTPALALLAGSAVNAASSLEEAGNKVNVVFGDASNVVRRFGDTAAESIGQSERQALAAAGAFGNMFNTVGLASTASADMSTTMVKLASDMASFNDADPSEMLEKLRSGLAGEAEPLRQFGVLLSAAEVSAKGMELGLADANGELTEADKVIARYNIILEQTAIQQGDFARTSDSLANQQRELTAKWEDARAELGENLLPVMSKAVDMVSGMLDAFNNLDEGTQNVIIGFGAAAAAAGPLLVVGSKLVTGFRAIKLAAAEARVSTMALSGVRLGAFAALVGVIAENFLNAGAAARSFVDSLPADLAPQERLRAMNDELERQNELAGDAAWDVNLGLVHIYSSNEAADANENAKTLADEIERLAAALKNTVHLDKVNREIGQVGDRFHGASEATDSWTSSLLALEAATDPLPALLDTVFQTVQDFVNEGAFDAAVTRMGEALRGFGDPMSAFESALEDGEASLDEWIAEMVRVATAQDEFATNMQLLATRVSDETFAAFQEMAQRNPEQAAIMAAEAVGATDEKLAELDGIVDRHTQAAIDAMSAAIPNAEAVAARFGEQTVRSMTDKLRAGTTTVAEIANLYTRGLQAGINPILLALGEPAIVSVTGGPGGITEFAHGGQVGQGYGTRDDVPAMLTRGEFVMPVDAVRTYGPAAMEAIREGTADIQYYAGGGFVSLDSVPRPPSVAPYTSYVGEPGRASMGHAFDAVMEWLPAHLAPPAGAGWRAMMDWLHASYGPVTLFSGPRPGAITATGNRSFHGQLANDGTVGRAVDIDPSAPLFEHILAAVGNRTAELIFSPMGNRQVRKGSPHYYGEPTRGDHWDHIHWALANGGIVNGPTRALIGESGPEAVIPLDRPLGVVVQGFAAGVFTPGSESWQPTSQSFGRPGDNGGVSAAVARLIGDATSAAPEVADHSRELTRAIEQRLRLYDQLGDAEDQRNRQLAQITAQAEAQAEQLAQARRDSLNRFGLGGIGQAGAAGGDLGNPFLVGFGSSNLTTLGAAGAAAVGSASGRALDVVMQGNAQLREFAGLLDDLRARGLSEDTIVLLGLDSPEQLATLRDLSDDTLDEIIALNNAVADRFTITGGIVADEQANLLGTLGASLVALNEQTSAALQAVQEQFMQTADAIAAAISEVTAAIQALNAAVAQEQASSAAVAASGGRSTWQPPGGPQAGSGQQSYHPMQTVINVTAPSPRSAAVETAAAIRGLELSRGWG